MSLRATTLAVLIIYASTLVGAVRAFFSTSTNIWENLTFTPVGTLEVLSESAFTTLAHPAFPAYGVRLKKSQFCDGGVNAYTGYIDIEARHLFFYFFESRNDPDSDDVIFWTNGGPGCSSGMGLFMELGPCRVHNAENGTVFHPESWNSNANIFFIDQPIGVGFSYADYGEYVSTTEEAAQDIAAFVAIFFSHFTKFQGRGFHMAGESYGTISTLLRSCRVRPKSILVETGMPPINLSSVMIGNGMTDVPTMMQDWYEMQCTPASIPPVQDIQTCVQMKIRLPRCIKWLQESCQDVFDLINCSTAMAFCQASLLDPYFALGLNGYDLSKKCEGNNHCYTVMEEILKFLNRKDVQLRIGVDVTQYESCSSTVALAFGRLQNDLLHGSTEYVAALLERDIRVLVYVGSYDWVCNWIGNEAWTLALEWSGRSEFAAQPLREWTVNGKRAGKTRSAKGFTFATVDGAGHMVPCDKPKESLEMVKRWIAGKPL
ncbi:serine carboxypeptidase [Mycena galopus ATCC 62051]|nr:serine carboxypeptidase [Mycena galopus ATCC 62051]